MKRRKASGSHNDLPKCGVKTTRRKAPSGRKVRRASSAGSELEGCFAATKARNVIQDNTEPLSCSRHENDGSTRSEGPGNNISNADTGDIKGDEPEREETNTEMMDLEGRNPIETIALNQKPGLPRGWRRCSLITCLPPLPPLASLINNTQVYRGPTDESNWVIPGKLMVGAYPASLDQALHERQLSSILDLGIRTFVCLQREYDGKATEWQWKTGKRIRPYIHDAATMLGRHTKSGRRDEVKFVHCPIVDCDTTADEIIVELAANLLRRLDVGETIYLHCWGGHGRAGTVASLLIGLLYGLNGLQSMQYVQTLHDTRRFPLDTPSPQTQKQRDQVIRILRRFYAEKSS